MELVLFLTVSHGCWLSLKSHGFATCLSLLLATSQSLSQFHGVVACLLLLFSVSCSSACISLSPIVSGSLSLSLLVQFSCYMSLTLPSSFMKFLHVFHYLLCFLAVSHSLSGLKEFRHFSHCRLWLLAFSNSLSDPMRLLHVSHCLSLLLAVSHSLHGVAACFSLSLRSHGVDTYLLSLLASSHCLSKCNRVAACLSVSPMVAGFLSLSLPVPWNCCTFPTVYHFFWLSLTLSHGVATCLQRLLVFQKA